MATYQIENYYIKKVVVDASSSSSTYSNAYTAPIDANFLFAVIIPKTWSCTGTNSTGTIRLLHDAGGTSTYPYLSNATQNSLASTKYTVRPYFSISQILDVTTLDISKDLFGDAGHSRVFCDDNGNDVPVQFHQVSGGGNTGAITTPNVYAIRYGNKMKAYAGEILQINRASGSGTGTFNFDVLEYYGRP